MGWNGIHLVIEGLGWFTLAWLIIGVPLAWVGMVLGWWGPYGRR